MQTFSLLRYIGLPWEAEKVRFVVGRHLAGEEIQPFYHDDTASVSQIIFETNVGEKSCFYYLV